MSTDTEAPKEVVEFIKNIGNQYGYWDGDNNITFLHLPVMFKLQPDGTAILFDSRLLPKQIIDNAIWAALRNPEQLQLLEINNKI